MDRQWNCEVSVFLFRVAVRLCNVCYARNASEMGRLGVDLLIEESASVLFA